MPRTLVLGAGFIGSAVALRLAAEGEPAAVLTRSRPDAAVAAAVGEERLLLANAADPGAVAAALAGVERVAFCAGGLLPVESEREPERDEELTLRPLEAVLAALRERPGVRFAYLSSGGTIYGNPSRVPVREEDPAAPISSYGKLNLRCEELIEAERREHGLASRILRCATVYGERQYPDRGQGAIVTFLDRIERGAPIDLFGGETTVRDYMYVGDVAEVVAGVLELEGAPPVLNVGSGEGRTLLEVLRLAEAEVGRPAHVQQHPERDFDVHRIVLDTTLLHDLMELRPMPLPDGIARTHRWLRGLGEGAR